SSTRARLPALERYCEPVSGVNAAVVAASQRRERRRQHIYRQRENALAPVAGRPLEVEQPAALLNDGYVSRLRVHRDVLLAPVQLAPALCRWPSTTACVAFIPKRLLLRHRGIHIAYPPALSSAVVAAAGGEA